MSKLIVICGLPGTGKTTLAKEISKKLNIVCLHKDSIKENLYELEEGKTLEDSRRIGEKSILLQRALAEEMIQRGVDLIIEAPFNHPNDAAPFSKRDEKNGVDMRVVICEVNEEERSRRYRERTRHHGHHDHDRLALGQYKKDMFDYSAFPGEKLSLMTDRPIVQLVEETMTFLRS